MALLTIFAYCTIGVLLASKLIRNDVRVYPTVTAKWRCLRFAALVILWAPLALVFMISVVGIVIYNIIAGMCGK